MLRVDVASCLYRWASVRSGVDDAELHRRFPKLAEWEAGACSPTLKQLERFAKTTKTPVGYFFLAEPPVDVVPIPDLRTVGDRGVPHPSPDLLEVIYQCQQRQEWYRGHALGVGLDPVSQVGSLSTSTPSEIAASAITADLSFSVEQRGTNWSDAFSCLRDRAEGCGVLVMVSGVVGSNTHRVLDPQEFRGFALADPLAPVVFVNGADTKAAQIFTLAHELAHIWLGGSALSDADLSSRSGDEVERWCNMVAAELLVPLDGVRSEFMPEADFTSELDRLARLFKSSTLVVLHRVYESGFLAWDGYRRAYQTELERVTTLRSARGTGGNFYNTQPIRVSRRFARSVIADTLEGRTLYRDALRMLSIKKINTFHQLSKQLGIA